MSQIEKRGGTVTPPPRPSQKPKPQGGATVTPPPRPAPKPAPESPKKK